MGGQSTFFAARGFREHSGNTVVMASLGLLLALSFLLGNSIAVGSSGEFPYSVTTGYYQWLASFVLAISAAASRILQQGRKHSGAVLLNMRIGPADNSFLIVSNPLAGIRVSRICRDSGQSMQSPLR